MTEGADARGDVARSADDSDVLGSTVWRRATSTAYVETPQRVVILDLDHLDRPPYVFEGTAAEVWACLDGVRTGSEVVADLAEAFEVPVETIQHDVAGFIDDLAELGLLVAQGHGSSPLDDRDPP